MKLGNLQDGSIKIENAFADLALVTSASLDTLKAAGSTVTITRQTKNAGRVDIIQDIPMHVFLSLFSLGDDPSLSIDGTWTYIITLGDGNFEFASGEYLTLEVTDLASEMALIAIEAPIMATRMSLIDRFVSQRDSLKTKFPVDQYETVAYDIAHVKTIRAQYDNGRTIEFDKDDLKIISRDLQPIDQIRSATHASAQRVIISNTITFFSLIGVVSLEVEKTQGELVDFYMLDSQ